MSGEVVEEKKVCPRCQDQHLVGDFQGEYCRWCIEDFNRIGDEAPIQDGRDLPAGGDDFGEDHEAPHRS